MGRPWAAQFRPKNNNTALVYIRKLWRKPQSIGLEIFIFPIENPYEMTTVSWGIKSPVCPHSVGLESDISAAKVDSQSCRSASAMTPKSQMSSEHLTAGEEKTSTFADRMMLRSMSVLTNACNPNRHNLPQCWVQKHLSDELGRGSTNHLPAGSIITLWSCNITI